MRTTAPFLLTGLTLCALPALAQSQCDWTIGIGAHQVNPKSDNRTLAGGALPLRIDSHIKPTATLLRRPHRPARCVSHSYSAVREGANG
ncbi:putative secreted protein [Xanthomonas translucens pv. poae]|uniref:Putative secreted protein n=1 Tax=Xanthomonas graminis pv. poae TaxID=227946 RepID=A0A0K2ZQV0_9XANT|nr:putative secreted protein [Xanthomonas translucens pv. poae]